MSAPKTARKEVYLCFSHAGKGRRPREEKDKATFTDDYRDSWEPLRSVSRREHPEAYVKERTE